MVGAVPVKMSVEESNTSVPSARTQKKKKPRKIVKTGVVYIKHIPHGFYEDEMKGFFSQFGKVLKVCVARSPKTGNSKGYGYIQFMDAEVAKIAAETMNNYLMFEKIIKCKVMPPEQVTAATFANASRRPGHNCPGQRRAERAVELLSARRGRVQRRNALKRREAAQRRTVAQLAQLGIKYDLAGGVVEEVEPVLPEPPSPAAAAPKTSDSPAVLKVDESDDEITFKTPPNTIRRRLSKPAASTPQAAAAPPAASRRPGTGSAQVAKQRPASTKTPPKSAKKSPKSAKVTPKSAKASPRSAKKTPRSAKASPRSAKATPRSAKRTK